MRNHISGNIFKILLSAFVLLLVGAACVKDEPLSTGAYEPAPMSPVVFYGKEPSPKEASSGQTVTFEVKGLKTVGNFRFFVNQIEAEVVSITDSLITVKIPENASTGPGTVLTSDGQYFYGPNVTITGKVYIDPDFEGGIGTNGPITDVYSSDLAGHIMVGAFTDYKGRSSSNPVNSIVKINNSGIYVAYNAGLGMQGGRANTLLPLNTAASSFLIGGYMSRYGVRPVSNVTRVFSNGALDSMVVDMINPEPQKFPQNSRDTVPTFNGYFSGEVIKMFKDATNKNVILGNGNLYYRYYYTRAQKNAVQRDFTFMRNFVRVSDDGVLDSTFNFNPATGQSFDGLNGFITTAIQLPNKTIMFGGLFTKFNDVEGLGRIAVLNNTGGINMTYKSAFGTGANGLISKMTYNATTKKILVTGAFTEFNGFKTNGIVMLNEDGSVDRSFVTRAFEGGVPNYAGQLKNGRILVSGTFNKYDQYPRLGFMVLNPDGSLAAGYNNTGAFSGVINGLYETASVQGVPAVLLYGNFNTFDNKKVGNLVQINMLP